MTIVLEIVSILIILIFFSFSYSLLKNTLFSAPWVPLSPKTIDRILSLAEIVPSDILYDLGSGDGRIIIIAAKKYKIRTRGVENSWPLWLWSLVNIYLFGLKKLVKVKHNSFFDEDLSEATIVVFFLMPKIIDKLLPKLKQNLRPKTKVVSAGFKINNLEPIKIDRPTPKDTPIYLYNI